MKNLIKYTIAAIVIFGFFSLLVNDDYKADWPDDWQEMQHNAKQVFKMASAVEDNPPMPACRDIARDADRRAASAINFGNRHSDQKRREEIADALLSVAPCYFYAR